MAAITYPVYSQTGLPMAYRYNDGFRCALCTTAHERPPIAADVLYTQTARCVDCHVRIPSAGEFSLKKHGYPVR